MTGVSISGLTKRFGSVIAVDNVSLELRDGEFFGLLGPSGSGKTTLMRCIAGFVSQDAGRIEVGSVDLQGIPTYRRDIGMVFQNYALFPHMTVQENVGFSLKVRGTPKDEIAAQVRSMLEMVQLSGYENRLPRELSGGQQQRVALARAIVSKPSVLLLDEPLNALDKHLRQHMQIELKQIQRAVGITTVFVTHDQDEALSLCDRIAIFRNGKIVQLGVPGEAYERPNTEFVAEFLGAANFLRGRALNENQIKLESGEIVSTHERLPAKGAPVTIVVRPEKFCITLENISESASAPANRLGGTIEKLVYLGSSTTYLVRVLTGELTVYQQNLATTPLRTGDKVILTWQPEFSILLTG